MNARYVPQGCRRLIAACLAAAFLTPILSQPAVASGLLIADNGFGGVLEIKEQDVKVTINNGVALTEVEQIFRNPTAGLRSRWKPRARCPSWK